jgi:hypothetical protein
MIARLQAYITSKDRKKQKMDILLFEKLDFVFNLRDHRFFSSRLRRQVKPTKL